MKETRNDIDLFFESKATDVESDLADIENHWLLISTMVAVQAVQPAPADKPFNAAGSAPRFPLVIKKLLLGVSVATVVITTIVVLSQKSRQTIPNRYDPPVPSRQIRADTTPSAHDSVRIPVAGSNSNHRVLRKKPSSKTTYDTSFSPYKSPGGNERLSPDTLRLFPQTKPGASARDELILEEAPAKKTTDTSSARRKGTFRRFKPVRSTKNTFPEQKKSKPSIEQ